MSCCVQYEICTLLICSACAFLFSKPFIELCCFPLNLNVGLSVFNTRCSSFFFVHQFQQQMDVLHSSVRNHCVSIFTGYFKCPLKIRHNNIINYCYCFLFPLFCFKTTSWLFTKCHNIVLGFIILLFFNTKVHQHFFKCHSCLLNCAMAFLQILTRSPRWTNRRDLVACRIHHNQS